jgi:hypothetical protein
MIAITPIPRPSAPPTKSPPCEEHCAADLIPESENCVLSPDLEVVGLTELEAMTDPHDLSRLPGPVRPRVAPSPERW